MKKILSVILLFLIFFSINYTNVSSYTLSIELTPEEIQFIEDNPEIRLGVDNRFQPYEFIDIDGEYKGICADYVALIETYTGLNFVIPFPELTWTEVFNKAKVTDEIDVLACIGVTTERLEYFDFSDPYYGYERAIFSNKNANTAFSLEDLPNLSVGVQSNSSHNSFLLSETSVTPIAFETLEDALYELSENKIDVVVGNLATTAYTIKQINITNIEVDSIISTENNKLAFAVDKDLPILTSIINKGLSAITNEEKILINNKWIDISERNEGVNLKDVLIISAIIITVIIIIVTLISRWNYLLKKTVRLKTADLNKSVVDLVNSLVKASEFKNKYTANHALRVAAYSRLIFEQLNSDITKCEEFELSAKLHDIGKLGIKDKLLLKPGKFTKEEYFQIQSHAKIGSEILFEHASTIIRDARIISHQHHERFNGTGYPQGLKNDEIHLYARIVSIADVFDALTSYRTYKNKWDFEDGFNYIIKNANLEFDPKLVKIFMSLKTELKDLFTIMHKNN